MKHRHLELAPDVPLEQLPSAALVDVLDRGDLDDWRPILEAIRVDPEGAFAARVLELVDRFPMYGTSTLFRMWIDRMRAAHRFARGSTSGARLKDLRLREGLTQSQLAERMGMTQSDLSKLEHREDIRLSTLANYVRALGGALVLQAELHGQRHRMEFPSRHRESEARVSGGASSS